MDYFLFHRKHLSSNILFVAAFVLIKCLCIILGSTQTKDQKSKQHHHNFRRIKSTSSEFRMSGSNFGYTIFQLHNLGHVCRKSLCLSFFIYRMEMRIVSITHRVGSGLTGLLYVWSSTWYIAILNVRSYYCHCLTACRGLSHIHKF